MASQLRSYGLFNGPRGSLFFERGQPRGAIDFVYSWTWGYNQCLSDDCSHLTKFDLVRFDWSGHGQSSTPQTTNIDTYVDDCEGE